MTTHTAALPTSLITRHPTVNSCINWVVSPEQPCSQCSTHTRCHVTYSLLNAITWTSHNCSQCSVSNLRYTFWHSAVSPSQLYTIQLWYRLLWLWIPSFLTLSLVNKHICSNWHKNINILAFISIYNYEPYRTQDTRSEVQGCPSSWNRFTGWYTELVKWKHTHTYDNFLIKRM